MKKNIFVAVVCGCFLLPNVLFVALHPFIDTENHENRAYGAFPEISVANYTQITSELETYYTDRLPFKNQFRRIASELDRFWNLGKSEYETYYALDTVTQGIEDWYFYTVSQPDENSVTELFGRNLYTEEQLDDLAEDAQDAKDFFDCRGETLILCYPPNKEFVYSEKLPEAIANRVVATSRCEQLADYIKEHTNVPVSFPLETLQEGKAYGTTYYRYDTHWNPYGGFLATQEILGLLGKEQLPLTADLVLGSQDNYPRDLLSLLGTYETTPDTYAWVNYKPEVGYETVEFYNNDFARFRSMAEDDRTILIYGDSFSWAMWEPLIHDFQEVIIVTSAEDAAKIITEENPEIIILETVQRRYRHQETALPELVSMVKEQSSN